MAGNVDTYIGSAGTLVAASMETAGYYLQDATLRVIAGNYGQMLAAFIYTITLISAAVIFSVGGQYKFSRWLLIQPGLFAFVLFTTVETTGVEWKFGPEAKDQTLVMKLNDGVTEFEQTARVSWLFARWNQIVSQFVSSFVHVITLVKEPSERDIEYLLTKPQKYQLLMTLGVDNNDINAFLSSVFLKKCPLFMRLHQELYVQPQVLKPEEVERKIEYVKKLAVLSPNDEDMRLVRNLVEHKLIEESELPGASGLQGQYTCEDLWTLTLTVMKKWAAAKVEDIGDVQLDNLVRKFKAAASADGATGDVETEAKKALINTVALASLLKSANSINPALSSDPKVASDQRSLVMLSREQMSYNGDEPLPVERYIRELNMGYEYQGKGEFLNSMLSLPYMQGLILYFLAWLYPWFAFMLLIPQRYTSFFHWFGLWFWVKSWDIGMAVVLLIDDLLFFLMPSGQPITDRDLIDNLGEALKMASHADPSSSASMYYVIMATLIGAVPVLSAFIVKKGSGEVISALSQGFGTFSRQVGTSGASFLRPLRAQQLSLSVENNKVAAFKQAYNASLNRGMEEMKVMSRVLSQVASITTDGLAKNPSAIPDSTMKALLKNPHTGRVLNALASAGPEEAYKYMWNRVKARAAWEGQRAFVSQSMSQEDLMSERLARMNKFASHELIAKNWDPMYIEAVKAEITLPVADELAKTPYQLAWGAKK